MEEQEGWRWRGGGEVVRRRIKEQVLNLAAHWMQSPPCGTVGDVDTALGAGFPPSASDFNQNGDDVGTAAERFSFLRGQLIKASSTSAA